MKSEASLSVVIPAYNEEENVANLHKEIVEACKVTGRVFEVIFVDDGSSDGTLEALKELSPVKIISFRKNFGQTAALDAGFKSAVGEYIVAMDGDGQNDPAAIPDLLKYAKKHNLDIVSGWRKNRKDSFGKKTSSLLAAAVRRFLINDGVHDSGCTLKLYKKECFDSVDLYGEMHRFIPAILKIKGFKIGEMVVNHRPRTAGVTKYNWSRGFKGILDMISVWFWMKFANRPLHLFGSFGGFLSFLGFGGFILALYQNIFLGKDLSDTALTTISLVVILLGIQFVVFGLLADIASKTYFSSTKDRPYNIKDVIEND